jgi:hypothetical protein
MQRREKSREEGNHERRESHERAELIAVHFEQSGCWLRCRRSAMCCQRRIANLLNFLLVKQPWNVGCKLELGQFMSGESISYKRAPG